MMTAELDQTTAAVRTPSIVDVIELLNSIATDTSGTDEAQSAASLKVLKVASLALSARIARLSPAGAKEFDLVERKISVVSRQPLTTSGFPRIRPDNCAEIVEALENAFNASEYLFRTGDPEIGKHFEDVVEAFSKTDVRNYPGEFQRTLLLLGRTRLARGDAAGTLTAISFLAQRPYLIEMSLHPTLDLFCNELQASTMLGDIESCAQKALWRAIFLARQDFRQTRNIGLRFANFIGIGDASLSQFGTLPRMAQFFANGIADFRRRRGKPKSVGRAQKKIWLYSCGLALTIFLLSIFRGVKFGRTSDENDDGCKDLLVTRAMGGIGDLLMMTPGIQALSMKVSRKIKVATPRRFFPVFANNPHVDLIDIEGPPLDLSGVQQWHNFTICPAGRYEARKQPNVRKGRVEIFARALNVSRADLDRSGWQVRLSLTPEQIAFCQDFLNSHNLGRRKILGIQPYSRDSYKDHPHIVSIIEDLARDHDVILFHHRDDGLPTGAGICNTAGLSLEKSLALVSVLKAMVSVDSAFLHATSAFDIPVVALFGPTDGSTFTRHHRSVRVLEKKQNFSCQPCWRNEDLPCHVTGSVGFSPCIAEISIGDIRGALESFDRARSAS